MIDPKSIFVDTSAWIEHILKKELHHKEVYNYLVKEVREGSKFYTSDYILDETYTRLLTNQSIKDAKNFKEHIKIAQEQNNLTLLFTNQVTFYKAWEYFEKFSEHKLSFTDATIITFVKDLKINEVLTLDQGFKNIGLTVKPDLNL